MKTNYKKTLGTIGILVVLTVLFCITLTASGEPEVGTTNPREWPKVGTRIGALNKHVVMYSVTIEGRKYIVTHASSGVGIAVSMIQVQK